MKMRWSIFLFWRFKKRIGLLVEFISAGLVELMWYLKYSFLVYLSYWQSGCTHSSDFSNRLFCLVSTLPFFVRDFSTASDFKYFTAVNRRWPEEWSFQWDSLISVIRNQKTYLVSRSCVMHLRIFNAAHVCSLKVFMSSSVSFWQM